MWQAYFELGQREGVWAPRKSKSVAKQQNTCSTYGRSEALVKQRQKTIEHQIRQTMNELQQHKDQLPEWTDQAQPPIRSTALLQALETLVEEGCLDSQKVRIEPLSSGIENNRDIDF